MKNAKYVVALCAALMTTAAVSQTDISLIPAKRSPEGRPVLQSWMSPEVGDAWRQGHKGRGVTVQVIDDFTSSFKLFGDLGTGPQTLLHGQWTLKEASMIAPAATFTTKDFNSGTQVVMRKGLNVLNLSWAAYAPAGFTVDQIAWDPLQRSIIDHAANGNAVISKAAGNDSIAIGGTNFNGQVDYLNLALKCAPSAIIVGALNSNGSVATPAVLAGYSNTAGNDSVVQKHFLVVGVEGNKTGLFGTSFAAPIVSGYAAILGSKFPKAAPTQIANQLLNTARQDTIADYSALVHGQGEASITRALAPKAIN